jgi:ketosteroid isomerase-like protein
MMVPRYRLTVAALITAACAHASVQQPSESHGSHAADERAIRGARITQNGAMAARDADLAATFWTEDVTIRRALGQDVHGRDAYKQLVVPAGNRDSSLVYQRDATSIEVSDHFPLAFESGTWVGHLGRLDGPVVIGGRYSAQWVKRRDSWLIRSEVFVALSCASVGCSYQAVP